MDSWIVRLRSVIAPSACLFTLTVGVKASIYGKLGFFPTGYYKLIIHENSLPKLAMSFADVLF